MTPMQSGRSLIRRSLIRRSLLGWLVVLFGLLAWPAGGARLLAAEWDLTPRTLARIPAGTRFREDPPPGWTNIILFVEARLASGDVSAASDLVQKYAEKFNLVILANVARDPEQHYYLDKVAIGLSTRIDGESTVITPDTQRQLGANLGLIGGRVLAGNEEALADIQQAARYQTSMLVDAPTLMLYEGDHRMMMVRFLVWVSPTNGRLGTAIWLMDENGPDRPYRLVEDRLQYLPTNMREDRVMNVKADRFTFGIPGKDAFALVRIPQGAAYSWTPGLRRFAGERTFTKQTYLGLLSELSQALSTQQPLNR